MKKQLINNPTTFQHWCRTLGEVIALDFETTSLNYTEMEFVGFSLCDGDRAMYSNNPKLLIYLAALFDIRTWVFHNAVFDLKCCRKFCKSEPELLFCTLTGAKLVNENLFSHSLKHLAKVWLGVPKEEILKWEKVSNDVESPQFIDYAQNDAIWTYQLYQYIIPILQKEDLEYISKIEMDFQRVLMEMEINGALVDTMKLAQFQQEVPAILDEIRIEMCGVLGVGCGYNTNLFGERELWTERDFGSSAVLIEIAESLGFEIFERTKKSKMYPNGQKSFAKEAKGRLKGQHPFFDLVYRYGKLNHLNNNFVKSLGKFIDSDGRVRTSHMMVRTGRLSSSKPALQQLPNPKKEKLEFNHREVFIPEPGNVLIKADYSGQELRVLGEVTSDGNVLDAFSNNYDLHLFTANRVFSLGLSDETIINNTEAHKRACEEYSADRYKTKSVNFGIIYGQTVGGLAKALKVSKQAAQEIVDGFFKLYPGVKKSIDTIPRELSRNGCVSTLFGRRRRFPGYAQADRQDKAAMGRQAFNMKIQGSSADIGKIAGISLLKVLPKEAKIVLFIHDEYVIEAPKEIAKDVEKIMKDCLENAVALRVRMVADTKIVDNFGA